MGTTTWAIALGSMVALLALAAGVAQAAPAVVTHASGDVQLVSGGQAAPLPALPALLTDGQTLTLAAGASAVVLSQGTATKVAGPATFDPASLAAAAPVATEAVGALDGLITRRSTTARPAASRAAGELVLVRPVPRTRVLAPAAIVWECDDCGPTQVEIYDLRADETVWSGEGEGAVRYDGPALKPGGYYVVIGGRDFPFTVAPPEERDQVAQARVAVDAAVEVLQQDGVSDPASLVSLPAAVLLGAEMPTEALYLIDAALGDHPDDAALQSLRETYERAAGLRP